MPSANRTTFGFENANRLVSVTNPLGHIATTVFVAVGQTIATVDDAANHVTASINPLGYGTTGVL